jgi:hypothetical protein
VGPVQPTLVRGSYLSRQKDVTQLPRDLLAAVEGSARVGQGNAKGNVCEFHHMSDNLRLEEIELVFGFCRHGEDWL